MDGLFRVVTLGTVCVGGTPAAVSFSGVAPGYVGLYQVNAQVPSGIAPNNAVTVAVSIAGKELQHRHHSCQLTFCDAVSARPTLGGLQELSSAAHNLIVSGV
jgi:hypothetical protein